VSVQQDTQLRDLLRGMDLPAHRKENFSVHNLRWLSRNLSVRNSDHQHYGEAAERIKQLLKEGGR